mmetsp:Transcript_22042/g.51870  ORF Transcript_22042/g.51870 Transcript_22042/m.51870 type:complete len:93 (-) Transcript_22042:3-281(-)
MVHLICPRRLSSRNFSGYRFLHFGEDGWITHSTYNWLEASRCRNRSISYNQIPILGNKEFLPGGDAYTFIQWSQKWNGFVLKQPDLFFIDKL